MEAAGEDEEEEAAGEEEGEEEEDLMALTRTVMVMNMGKGCRHVYLRPWASPLLTSYV